MLTELLLTHYMRWFTSRKLTLVKSGKFKPDYPKSKKPMLLYIHIPFCEGLCPYCSFFRIPFKKNITASYFTALKNELILYKEKNFNFSSIYIGGGTPTVMPEKLADLVKITKTLWNIEDVSVETNPNHLKNEILDILKKTGVKRLSVGVQSFNNSLLNQIGRLKPYGTAEDIIKSLRRASGIFNTLNVDMIFNLPGQSEEMLRNDLEILLSLKPDQITFYPLMGSNKKLENVKTGVESQRTEKKYYKIIISYLEKEYANATAWCFTKKGGMIDEYIVEYDEYAGAGAGAFGYINGNLYSNLFSIKDYINLVNKNEFPIAGKNRFGTQMQIKYYLMMRLFQGNLNLAGLKKQFGNNYPIKIGIELLALILSRSIIYKNGLFSITPKGRYYMVVLMREFFNGVNNLREIMKKTD